MNADLNAVSIAHAILQRVLSPVDARSRHNAWAAMSEQAVRRRERADVAAYLAAQVPDDARGTSAGG